MARRHRTHPLSTLPFLFLLSAIATRTLASFTPLSAGTLSHPSLRATHDDFDHEHGALLSPILIPRVPGTPGSLKVLTHFQHFFTTHLPTWQLSTQNSSQTTPLSGGKKVPFVNFIATRDPPWKKDAPGDVGRLVLAAHYDSKVSPKGFIGATDSAVPCAVLLHTARAIDKALTKKWEAMTDEFEKEEERGVMILLLDGEEAFEMWTNTDSLYGARSLAEEWEGSFHPALSTYKTALSSIELFVLLDLLGSQAPRVPSYFPTTHWAYQAFADTEQQLRDNGLFETAKKDKQAWFYDKEGRGSYGRVEDDHIPFLQRGVEVVHIIPSPFPQVWHTKDDDGKHLHAETVRDWGTLTASWAAGILGLEGHFEGGAGGGRKRNIDADEGRKTEL